MKRAIAVGALLAANLLYLGGCTTPTEPRRGYVKPPVGLSIEQITRNKLACKDFARKNVMQKYKDQIIDDIVKPWNIILEGWFFKPGNKTQQVIFDDLYKKCLKNEWKVNNGK